MNNDIIKFQELLLNDQEFQGKLKEAVKDYKGEATEEAFFQEILVPFAEEYGISASYEEYREYIEKRANEASREILTDDELAQISGGTMGKGSGYGGLACSVVGIGLGGGGGNGNGGACYFVGAGWGGTACWGEGETVPLTNGY